MSLSITLNSYTFDTKKAECGFYLRALDLVKSELGRGQGTVTSGTIIDRHPSTGASNTSLGSWTFTPSGSIP